MTIASAFRSLQLLLYTFSHILFGRLEQLQKFSTDAGSCAHAGSTFCSTANMSAQAGGLLRFPAFLRALSASISSQQPGRPSSMPSLQSPELTFSDISLSLEFAVLILCLRLVLNHQLAPRLFSRHSPSLRRKLSENLFYSIYYLLAFLYYAIPLRAAVTWRADLLSGQAGDHLVQAFLDPVPPPMAPEEHVYYAQAAGFYLSASLFLILFDSRRSDFRELILHHGVTIALVAASSFYGYVRAGVVVLALHDIGDVFLYSAKFLHHLGLVGWDTVVFAMFAATFYLTRLVMFPRLLYMICVETLQVVVERPEFNGWARWMDVYIWHYLAFVVLLGTLLVLHCFWFALILKMIYREVVLGVKVSEAGDIRSDDEGEAEDADMKDVKEIDDGFLNDHHQKDE